MAQADPIRAVIAGVLDWEEAHAGLDRVVDDLPYELQGRTPPGLPYSPWHRFSG
jgi:hypothetical protein